MAVCDHQAAEAQQVRVCQPGVLRRRRPYSNRPIMRGRKAYTWVGNQSHEDARHIPGSGTNHKGRAALRCITCLVLSPFFRSYQVYSRNTTWRDQSGAGSVGIFSRRTNQTQEAWVYSHDGPIRRRKRGRTRRLSRRFNRDLVNPAEGECTVSLARLES
eukprot:1185780-Prorocentrum_minimum.AAC.3